MRPVLKSLMVGAATALLAAACASTGTSGSATGTSGSATGTSSATATTPGAGRGSGSGTAEGPATVYGCDQKPVSQPKTYILACGDGGIVLEQLTWTGWGTAQATATGLQIQNSCVPNCAAGSPISTRATATLSGLSAGHYTKLHVVTTKASTDYTISTTGPLATG